MATVGFVINPMSGKDVRRIVSSATTIDNQEKANIAERAAEQRMSAVMRSTASTFNIVEMTTFLVIVPLAIFPPR